MKNDSKETQTQHTLSVYFCGQEDCGPNHSFGPAMRPHYLLHVIFHGKGIYQCSGHTYHLKSGDAFLIRPMDSIYYRADTSDPWSYAWAGFDGSACKEILKQTVFSDTPIFTPETPSRQNSLLTHMQSLLDTFSENNGNDLASTGNLLLILSDMQKKPSESRKLHVCMIVKYQQVEGLFHPPDPDSAHIMIISGINKINSGNRIFFHSFQNLRLGISIAIAVGS